MAPVFYMCLRRFNLRTERGLDEVIPGYILWYMKTTVMFKTDKKRKEAVQKLAKKWGIPFSAIMNQLMRDFIERGELDFGRKSDGSSSPILH